MIKIQTLKTTNLMTEIGMTKIKTFVKCKQMKP